MKKVVLWMVYLLAAAVLLSSGVEYGDQLVVAIQQHQQREVDQWMETVERALEEQAEGEGWIARYPLALEAPILPTSERP